MIRVLQSNTAKNIPITKASEAMKRGMCITEDVANGNVDKATATNGFYLVDVAPTYDGIDAVITPNDSGWEDVAANQLVLKIPCYSGERYATNQITSSGLVKGDKLKADAGLFIKAETTDAAEWVYGGAYEDPTFDDMHIVQML